MSLVNPLYCHQYKERKSPGSSFVELAPGLYGIKPWLLYQDIRYGTRRKKIFLVISKEDCTCPDCGSPLCRRDKRLRVHKKAGGIKEWFKINRLKCTNENCQKLHNELPDCLSPYKHYDAELIGEVVDEVITADDLETENYPCEDTMKHWKHWIRLNETNINGQMKSTTCRFLDFGCEFLKSTDSLLQELKKRISPGWLSVVNRFIYNSGGRIDPSPGQN